MLSDDIRHKIFKAIEENPEINQRTLAVQLGVSGIEEKAKLTVRYLKRKMQEYELLKKEIDDLTKEVTVLESVVYF